MRIQIRILDPHYKKMDPDPGYFFKIYRIQRIWIRILSTG